MLNNVEDIIPGKTIKQWKALSEFYDENELINILGDLEKLCRLEKAFLEKKTGITTDDKAYRQMKAVRYSLQIDSLYQTTIEARNAQPNITEMVYTRQRTTELYRFVKHCYK